MRNFKKYALTIAVLASTAAFSMAAGATTAGLCTEKFLSASFVNNQCILAFEVSNNVGSPKKITQVQVPNLTSLQACSNSCKQVTIPFSFSYCVGSTIQRVGCPAIVAPPSPPAFPVPPSPPEFPVPPQPTPAPVPPPAPAPAPNPGVGTAGGTAIYFTATKQCRIMGSVVGDRPPVTAANSTVCQQLCRQATRGNCNVIVK